MALKYRPEVDGLRAIAVSSVVFYHADFLLGGRNPVQGGFIGVDIFFVISGYLITLIILGEMGQGRFSFGNFFERRARRILPALFTVILASIPFAWRYMLPAPMKEYAGSILSTLAFSSNIWFWLEDSYWAAPSALKPFLHTWTLAVEEQFYLFFPPVMLLIYKYAKPWITAILVTLFLLSLFLADFASRHFAVAGFYLLPMRGWELLAGALMARFELKRGRIGHPLLSSTMPSLGLLLVAYAIFTFSGETRHPSLITTIPILGTMLLIWFSGGGDVVSKLLRSRPFVALGLISYSLYLWHFPIFAFSKMAFDEISAGKKIFLILLAIALSIATYFLVERPARNKTRLPRRSLLALLATSGVVLVVVFASIYATEGAKFRLARLSKYMDVNYWRPENRARFSTQEGCWLEGWVYDKNEPFGQCRGNESLNAKSLILVIGDSNVAALIPGLIEYYGKENIVQRVVNDCRPYAEYFENVKVNKEHHEFCILGIRDALSDVSKLNPQLIILGGLYQEAVDAKYFSLLLSDHLDSYRDKIVVMGPLPRWRNLVRILTEKYLQDPDNFSVPERLTPTPATFALEELFKKFAQENAVGYLSPVQTFCQAGQCMVKISDEVDGISAWDAHHLTHKASSYLVDKNRALIDSYLDAR